MPSAEPHPPDRIAASDIPTATSGAPATAGETRKRGKRGRGPRRRHASIARRVRDGETPLAVLNDMIVDTTPTDVKIDRALDVRTAAWSTHQPVMTAPVDARLLDFHEERRGDLERRDGKWAGNVRTTPQEWTS